MKSMLAIDAAEYNAATDRISNALATLRDEMKSLRHQDVTLMRQFITMNDTIRSLSKDQKTERTRKKRMRNRTLVAPPVLPQTTLVRQQSVPRYCDVIPEVRERTWSCSSDEYSESSQDESLSDSMTSLAEETSSDDDDRMSSAIPVFRPRALARQRSRSDETQTQSEHESSAVEKVLRHNVQLWKGRQSNVDSDSVFEDSISESDESL
ncbi:uncharacterized protein LOC127848713 [Dreissena polymorpha]|uniref:Uncharacterized protein n=1 Tax=Dreissena polymorpha TaxID=45954 RepID=A0A9D4I350_DREPO|nr:uncharacterized protein LOC127848713 [Dreissena polymorpha]KAH3746425.1 hypothetical protein DPMN_180833 [Dreissena polymorpha]